MVNKIKEFLESNEALFEGLGYEQHSKENNGWEIDFWWKYIKDGNIITLEGCLYDGNFKLIK